MSLESIKSQIPDYAKDIKLNFSSLANDDSLTQAQLWGCFYASAYATGNAQLIQAMDVETATKLSDSEQNAAKSAASIMAMNNIYYRFAHLAKNKEYQTMPAKLRMNVIGNPGVDKKDFELWSLAVSVINGCGMCIDAHETALRNEGMSSSDIQMAARIASVVNSVACVLTAQEALSEVVAKAA